MTSFKTDRIQMYLIRAYAHEKQFFNVGPAKYDTKLAWKLIKEKQITAPIEDMPIAPYLRYVGFDPETGTSEGFKLHLDSNLIDSLTAEETKRPGIVVHSKVLGPILISGNLQMARLFKDGAKHMKVHVINSDDEDLVLHKHHRS